MELVAALHVEETGVELHVFEGKGFKGHIQMLLRMGYPVYPEMTVFDNWLGTSTLVLPLEAEVWTRSFLAHQSRRAKVFFFWKGRIPLVKAFVLRGSSDG